MELLLGIGLGALISTLTLMVFVKKRVEVGPHEALLCYKRGNPARVHLYDRMVIPFFEEVEKIDLSTKGLNWSFQGKTSIRCKDHRKAEIKVSLFFGLPREKSAILAAAKQLGTAKLDDIDVLSKIISPTMKEALVDVFSKEDFLEWAQNPSQLEERMNQALKLPIEGLRVEKLTLTELSPCPETHYDHTDPRDFKAILGMRQDKADLKALLQQIEDAEAVLIEAKAKQKEMMKEQLEVQRLRKILDFQVQKCQNP